MPAPDPFALPVPVPTGNPLRSRATWLLSHGLARRLLLREAARGDLLAGLAMDPALRADPFAGYEELRRRGPMTTTRLAAGTVDHAVADAVLRSEDFGVAGGHGELPRPLQWLLARVFDNRATGPVDPPSMLALDPPEHTRQRKLVSRAFTARKVGGLEDTIATVAARLVDELAAGPERVDLVDRFASRLPLVVIAELLGVPEEDHDRLLAWSNIAAQSLDPGLSWAEFRRIELAIRRLHVWFDAHVERLRKHPGDDLLSRLATLDGPDRPTEDELKATGLLVLGAGFETTVNLIGNAVALFDSHPDQLAVLRDDPGLWPRAVDEVLRFDSPVQITLRQAHRDTEVAGVRVAGGTAVLTFLGGANRDPAVFADPQRFDVTRGNADQHLSFSAGVHYCLGASLARLETKVALHTLYDRFPDLRVDGPPVRRGTRVLRGYEHLPIVLGDAAGRPTTQPASTPSSRA
ncbi:cytochrome P450 [Nocardioides terrisoli]|uniref:cytochrome P450 n=1 Tax=Nocardioides terrisoli TaxID=3388267 RepID=UPI00287BA250|nr:cytochrome P450 [Nocardioides marmorisolisilvae]